MKIFFVFFALFISLSVSAPIPAGLWSEEVELATRNKHMAQAVAIALRIRKAFRPKPHESVFWSGTKPEKNGQMVSVMGDAKKFALAHNKKILTQALSRHGIRIPAPQGNPLSSRLWNFASKAWALKAMGVVHAVLGSKRRPGNVYDNIEKPTLLKNGKVSKLIEHNAATGEEATVK
ncbi:hypothetical protein CVT26_015151 [Gymnopilus dilepis]|uniref:SCP domain-containing protein n=1 Tax=Gymnopilus dilepis TaxID=231916 RepID=A0A409WA22_9AGAR|nr:hypothetical protein CVT26_015151 [Gymnopilus dilepis]